MLILNATAHLGNGQVIPNSAIAFDAGKITMVADATTIRIDRTKFAKIFDATGKHIYPGLIAPATRIGLVEIDAARATNDVAETGSINPNARSIIAYNTDSELLPTIRSNGILMTQVVPEGGLVSGSSSIVQLDAWNWEDAAYRTDDGIWLNWPSPRSWGGWESGAPEMKKNDRYDKEVQQLTRYFEEARAYAQLPVQEPRNPRFEAMRGLFNGAQKLYIRVDMAKTIEESVLFAKKQGVQPVIVGGDDAWMVADFLRDQKVAVILAPTQKLPSRDDDAVDQPYKSAAMLHQKGVRFCFSSIGSWRQRNLPFMAGQAAGFGLDREAAVSALTLDAATILGIDKTCGSLEEGKDATLFISEGDVLDMRTSKVNAAFIQGREINLDNKHKQLTKRFETQH